MVKEKNDNLDYIKENVYACQKRPSLKNWERIFATYITDEGQIFLIYKETLNIEEQRTKNPTEKWERDMIR